MKKLFVFGSNLRGVHGAGAARFAFDNHNAKWGCGIGRTGDCYAIPTKDDNIKTLPLNVIKNYVDEFVLYAKEHPELMFEVTKIGCGLAGYKNKDIAPMFLDAPENCLLDDEWVKIIDELKINGN
uniref:Macro domain-containing protein n=1 Tax=viral metagenome TaxID=1070528 RepID=A0A6C0JU36_9ZZZZ